MFEKITRIDNSRERDGPREKNTCIEMNDDEHRARLQARLNAYKPIKTTSNTFKRADGSNEHPELPVEIEGTLTIQKDTKHEKSTRKTVKKKSKKIHS
jgi:hypothetical protein